MQIAGLTGAGPIAVSGTRIFIVHSTALAAVDNIDTTDGGAGVQVSIPIAAWNGTGVSRQIQVSPGPNGARDLWLIANGLGGEIVRFTGADTLTSSSVMSARFTHPFQQIFSMAHSPANDVVFGAQVSGAGIIAWTDAGTITGDAGTHTFTLFPGNTQQLRIAQNRLYNHTYGTEIGIWNDVSAASSSRAPDAMMDGGSGLEGSVRDFTVSGNTLVVTQQVGTAGKVNLYANASGISGNVAPTQVVTNAALTTQMNRAVLGSDGTLYVIDTSGIAIFSNALTAPTLKADITLSAPQDVLLIE